jgi:transcriptional regulator
MYTPSYAKNSDMNLAFEVMEQFSFATIISTMTSQSTTTSNNLTSVKESAKGLEISHLPLLLDRKEQTLTGHLAKNNPHYKLLKNGAPTRVLFHGPHSYISPTLYRGQLNVPTWSYVAIHAHCTPKIIEDAESIEAILQKTVHYFEDSSKSP